VVNTVHSIFTYYRSLLSSQASKKFKVNPTPNRDEDSAPIPKQKALRASQPLDHPLSHECNTTGSIVENRARFLKHNLAFNKGPDFIFLDSPFTGRRDEEIRRSGQALQGDVLVRERAGTRRVSVQETDPSIFYDGWNPK
jgi:hypothetical protein